MTEHPDETINSEKNDHNKLDMEYEQHITNHKNKERFPFLYVLPAVENFNEMFATSVSMKIKTENVFPIKEKNDDFTHIRQTDINNGEISTNEHKINIDPDPEYDNNDLKIKVEEETKEDDR